jgi:hypothetical protein
MKVIKLIADEQYGDGWIKLPDEWKEYDPYIKAMVLKGWINGLKYQLNSEMVKIDADLAIQRAMTK